MDLGGTCFVIQPFDAGVFDKRYRDVFEPAIKAAGLQPYRVDQDPRAAIPIENIEDGIRRADVCFAELSTDNPNVWFELGYAIATRKDVVLVCSDQRQTRFPFDVQHRAIIKYKTESASDFNALTERITNRLEASLKKQLEIGNAVGLSPIKATEGLTPHEVVALVTIAQNTDAADDSIAAYLVRQDMQKVGYTDIAVTLAVRSLVRKQLVNSKIDEDYNRNEFVAYSVTDRGMEWLEQNQSRLILKRETPHDTQPPFADDDDLPF